VACAAMALAPRALLVLDSTRETVSVFVPVVLSAETVIPVLSVCPLKCTCPLILPVDDCELPGLLEPDSPGGWHPSTSAKSPRVSMDAHKARIEFWFFISHHCSSLELRFRSGNHTFDWGILPLRGPAV
jgi:hypothetical protein